MARSFGAPGTCIRESALWKMWFLVWYSGTDRHWPLVSMLCAFCVYVCSSYFTGLAFASRIFSVLFILLGCPKGMRVANMEWVMSSLRSDTIYEVVSSYYSEVKQIVEAEREAAPRSAAG